MTTSEMIKAIANSIGIEADADKIDRAIYKGTDCGAWVRFDSDGVTVGTIVENSDAEYSERLTSDNAEDLCAEFWEAIQRCENFSSDVWFEMERAAEAENA